MKHTGSAIKILMAVFCLLNFPVQVVFAQDGPPPFVREAVKAVEKMLDTEDDKSIQSFIDEKMIPASGINKNDLFEKIKSIRHETKGLRDNIYVEAEPDGVSLFLASQGVTKRIRIKLAPEGISDLNLAKTADPVILTPENLEETFNSFEKKRMSGIIYIKKNGNILTERALGFANRELEVRNTLNTIFATGSRPIDYTIAAIYLLDQQNKINLNDSIDKYFANVPADKKTITIKHLLNGQSGLPDFFHTGKDWDPDLAWIDRETAEKRILSQQLLFKPGEDRQHSHGAFVLLAALIEHVSGIEYYSFLKKNFFEPAGMKHTGEYGETLGFPMTQFAEGDGPQFVGLPNIPPNWGPTSWLVKGSGGMYSTLDDLLKFYDYVRAGKVLDKEHHQVFLQPAVNLDGSDRGFKLFSASFSDDNQVVLFVNSKVDREKMNQLFWALEKFVNPQQ